jgi:hypothetical protein
MTHVPTPTCIFCPESDPAKLHPHRPPAGGTVLTICDRCSTRLNLSRLRIDPEEITDPDEITEHDLEVILAAATIVPAVVERLRRNPYRPPVKDVSVTDQPGCGESDPVVLKDHEFPDNRSACLCRNCSYRARHHFPLPNDTKNTQCATCTPSPSAPAAPTTTSDSSSAG